MTPNNDTDKQIFRLLDKTSERLGTSFDIPPKTASVIKALRESRARLTLRVDDSLHQHLGWHSIGQESIVGINIWYMLIEELAEIYEIPVSVLSALRLSLRSDPSFMAVTNRGPAAFFVDNHNQLTWDRTVATYVTPEYLRVAWDLAMTDENESYNVEDLLTLPRIYGLTDAGSRVMMSQVKTHSGPEVTVA